MDFLELSEGLDSGKYTIINSETGEVLSLTNLSDLVDDFQERLSDKIRSDYNQKMISKESELIAKANWELVRLKAKKKTLENDIRLLGNE